MTIRINWNGHPPLPLRCRKLRRAARIAIKAGCYITSTSDGQHTSTSYHYRRRAFDAGSSDPSNRPEAEAQKRIVAKMGARKFNEVFGPAPWYVKDGVRHAGRFPDHGDHLHVARG